MNTEEFNKAREEITDEQLINKAQEILHKLCKTGGRSFIMTVPPRIDDTDMIFGELINRYKKAIQMQAKVKPEIASKKNLYKVTLAYGYNYGKRFSFLVIAEDIESAVNLAISTFNSYDYGVCIFSCVELVASEGQYSEPEILLLAK